MSDEPKVYVVGYEFNVLGEIAETALDLFTRLTKRNAKRLTRKEKALLELIIAEVIDALPDVKRVERLLNGWVKANDLHPERVKRVTLNELAELLKEEVEGRRKGGFVKRVKTLFKMPMGLLAMGFIGASMKMSGVLAIALRVHLGMFLASAGIALWIASLLLGRREKRKMKPEDAERFELFMVSVLAAPVVAAASTAYAIGIVWLGCLLTVPAVLGVTALFLQYLVLRREVELKRLEGVG